MTLKERLLTWSVVGLVVLLTGSQSYAQDTKIRFVLDWKYEGEHAQFTVPIEDGFYNKHHVDVQLDRGAGSADTVTKVGSGTYDMGYADLYAMVRFNAANPGHQLIAVAINQDRSAVGIATLASSNITKPTDLNGKKIGAPPDAGKQLWPVFAKLNNVDTNSIEWENVSGDLRDTLLVRKQVDAVTGVVTTTMMNARSMGVPENGIRPFIYANYGIPLYGSSIVTTPAFAAAHPEAVRAFIAGLAHGLNVMIKDPEYALSTIKKKDPLLDDAIEMGRLKITLQYILITDHVEQYGLSQVDMARLQQTLDDVAGPFGINPPPQAAAVFTANYLPPASDLRIASWHPGQ
jgi:NitT/TauT family transport system substrate-binding protein